MRPAIVLSSHTMGLGVIRSLGVMGVPVVVFYYREQDMGYLSRYVIEKVCAPNPGKAENEFINLLLNFGERFGGSLLVPADDATLTAVSRNKEVLEEKYIVACTGWDICRKFIDKTNTYILAEQIGIPVPKTFLPRSVADLETAHAAIGYPSILKPCRGHIYFERFRKKMVKVHNFGELVSAYEEADAAGMKVMLQEFIPGDDTSGVNYNSYFHDGEALVEFTAEKVRLAPPEIGVPRVLVSKAIPGVIEPGRKILQALGFSGYSCTEFKRDSRDGVYKLMEVNGRHNLSILHALACGINFPGITYNHLIHDKLPRAYTFRTGIYWVDSTKDLVYSLAVCKKERYPLRQYLIPYLKPHVDAIFDRRDPKPFVKRCFDLGLMFKG